MRTAIQAVVGMAAVAVAVHASAQETGTVRILGGTLANQTIIPERPVIFVKAGQQLTGMINVRTLNNMVANAVAPFGYTWTWGDRKTAIKEVCSWIQTGQKDWNVSISLPGPVAPGRYLIMFGFNGEYNLSQVFSCDNWNSAGGCEWNDGNDYFDMQRYRCVVSAVQNGYVSSWPYQFDDTYRAVSVPCAMIGVVVK